MRKLINRLLTKILQAMKHLTEKYQKIWDEFLEEELKKRHQAVDHLIYAVSMKFLERVIPEAQLSSLRELREIQKGEVDAKEVAENILRKIESDDFRKSVIQTEKP